MTDPEIARVLGTRDVAPLVERYPALLAGMKEPGAALAPSRTATEAGVQNTLQYGGATIDPRTGAPASFDRGGIVAVVSDRNPIPNPRSLEPEVLQAEVDRRVQALMGRYGDEMANDPSLYIGFDGGDAGEHLGVELSRHLPDLQQAVDPGTKAGQRSVWDPVNMVPIPTGGTTRRRARRDPDLLPGLVSTISPQGYIMEKKRASSPVFVVVVFFLFVLLHQTDKLLIGSLQLPISKTFGLNDLQWGTVNSVALLVGTIFYPNWGYLYDRYARAKLLGIASFIWGATTWLRSIVTSYPAFLVTRSSTGIDDSAYPGLYSLVADYFGPKLRGRIYGVLQFAQPIGYLLGMILALMIAPMLEDKIFHLEGWRTIFLGTGVLGLAMAALIYFGIKDVPRGQSEPEFEGMAEMGQFRFNWDALKDVMKKKTMWFVFLQGFSVKPAGNRTARKMAEQRFTKR